METSSAFSIQLPRVHQISLYDVDESEEDKNKIIASAIAAIEAYMQMKESAIKVCLSLYQCRESFVRSGEKGWTKFCEEELKGYGLSLQHIRACVAAGKAFFNHQQRLGEEGVKDVAMLKLMSLSALEAVGSAPDEVKSDVISRVAEQIEANGGKSGITAKETSSIINELKAELAEKEGRLGEKDAALMRLSNTLRDRDAHISQLRQDLEEKEAQRRDAQSRSVEVVDADPNSKIMRAEIENLDREKNALIHEIDAAKASRQKIVNEIEAFDRKAGQMRMAQDVVEDMERMLGEMKIRFADAVIKKTIEANPDIYAERIRRISDDLRGLADKINPDLFSK